MRRKKVLFIVGTLQSGGVSKSLVNLLNVWDSEKYETSLLVCCKEGDVFSEFIPPCVTVLRLNIVWVGYVPHFGL